LTLFGRTLDSQDVASLGFLLMVLVLWVGAWRSDRRWIGAFRQWEADRKARRDAEIAAEGDDPSATPPSRGGPWG
jgi:hypothetical protein